MKDNLVFDEIGHIYGCTCRYPKYKQREVTEWYVAELELTNRQMAQGMTPEFGALSALEYHIAARA